MYKTINNRELLRNFRVLKIQLLSGQISEIRIPQENKKIIKMTVEEEISPTEALIKLVEKHGPFNIKRPEGDIFDW